MAKYRQIMELVLQGRSYAEIVEMIGCSRRDVARVRQIVAEHDVTSMDMITTEQLVGWFPDGGNAYQPISRNRILIRCWSRCGPTDFSRC